MMRKTVRKIMVNNIALELNIMMAKCPHRCLYRS